jgi:hypothetical protein
MLQKVIRHTNAYLHIKPLEALLVEFHPTGIFIAGAA